MASGCAPEGGRGSPSGFFPSLDVPAPVTVPLLTAATSTEPSRIRLVIATESTVFREMLARALEGQRGIQVVGTAAGRDQVLARVRERGCDIVLLDRSMPESVATVRAVLDTVPEVYVVALNVVELEDEVISLAEAGIAGYVRRDGSFDELLATVVSVAHGETALFSPRIAAALLRGIAALAAKTASPAEASKLTRREMEILRLIEAGLSNKEIAGRLGIEAQTVKNHVHHILRKLHVKRRGEAAARIRAERWRESRPE